VTTAKGKPSNACPPILPPIYINAQRPGRLVQLLARQQDSARQPQPAPVPADIGRAHRHDRGASASRASASNADGIWMLTATEQVAHDNSGSRTPTTLSATSVLLFLRRSTDPDPEAPLTRVTSPPT
jgi:hypothetical protein